MVKENEYTAMLSHWNVRKIVDLYFLINDEFELKSYAMPVEINEMGAQICSGIKEGLGIEEITSHLAERYGETADQIKEDVSEFVANIVAALGA